jgi:hypothetical protein
MSASGSDNSPILTPNISLYYQHLDSILEAVTTLRKQPEHEQENRLKLEQVIEMVTTCCQSLQQVQDLYVTSMEQTDDSFNQLSARKIAQNLALEHMQQMQMTRHVQKFRARLTLNSRRWKWMCKQDNWTKFLDSYLDYPSMSSELLYNDYKFIRSVTQMKSKEGVILDTMRDHFKVIVSLKGHAICEIIGGFAVLYEQRNDIKPIQTLDEQKKIQVGRVVLQRAIADVNSFVDKLVTVMFEKYWCDKLSDICNQISECKGLLAEHILAHIMNNTQIHKRIMELYHVIQKNENDALDAKLESLQNIKAGHFHVTEKFRCEEDAHPLYLTISPAIEKFQEFDSGKAVAREKAYCLIDCLREITKCINRYWNKQLDLSADDLLPLFCYLMSHVKPKKLFSTIQYLNDFVDESLLIGEVGYVLITLESSANYLLEFEPEEALPTAVPVVGESEIIKSRPRSRRTTFRQSTGPWSSSMIVRRSRSSTQPPASIVSALRQFHEDLAKKEREDIERERKIREAAVQRRISTRLNKQRLEFVMTQEEQQEFNLSSDSLSSFYE